MQKAMPVFLALAPPLRIVLPTALALRSFIVNADPGAKCNGLLSIASQNGNDHNAFPRVHSSHKQMLRQAARLPRAQKFSGSPKNAVRR